MTRQQLPLVLQAIEALNTGQRRYAASLLRQELDAAPAGSARWPSVSRLAAEIGEIEIAVEAARRGASSGALDSLLSYWAILATYGRSQDALAEIAALPPRTRKQPSVLHFLATLAGEQGQFAEAHRLFRQALSQAPDAQQIWFGLAMTKTFEMVDGDRDAMEALLKRVRPGDSDTQARLLYAIGKAWGDIGEADRAFSYFSRGAAMKKRLEPYNTDEPTQFLERAIRDFNPENMAKLMPSDGPSQRSLFVTGLPRSGTTLVQQILAAHSAVGDGAEVNLARPALLPTLDFTMEGALAYQARASGRNPWGEIAADYREFIDVRFRSAGLVVDKSLNQSMLMGLLLHSIPEARVVWLRRQPEDTALSCFSTFFTSLPWSWSLTDIAKHFRNEDRLFQHWLSLFPDRIFSLEYECLTQDPRKWIPAVLRHFGLKYEEKVYEFHRLKTNVRTASVLQVRSPLSSARIGAARAYSRHLEPFRQAYYD